MKTNYEAKRQQRGVNEVRQSEIHTAEPLVLEPSVFKVDVAVKNLEKI